MFSGSVKAMKRHGTDRISPSERPPSPIWRPMANPVSCERFSTIFHPLPWSPPFDVYFLLLQMTLSPLQRFYGYGHSLSLQQLSSFFPVKDGPILSYTMTLVSSGICVRASSSPSLDLHPLLGLCSSNPLPSIRPLVAVVFPLYHPSVPL